jgi:pilus assembly protein CpaE
MMSFDHYEGLKDKIKIVVNRVGLGNVQISLKKAQETVGQEIFWQIPNDYRTMVEVRNNGVPLTEHAPRAAITQAIVGLADNLAGDLKGSDEADPAAANNSRWLSFWPKKGRPPKTKTADE